MAIRAMRVPLMAYQDCWAERRGNAAKASGVAGLRRVSGFFTP